MKRMTRNNPRGQALVELAMVLPLVLLLGIALVQMLFALYLVQSTRAAAADAVELAAVYGGDTAEFRAQVPAILASYRLDPESTEVTVEPAQGNYLQPIVTRVDPGIVVKIYGLFDLPISPQEMRALSQKDWDW